MNIRLIGLLVTSAAVVLPAAAWAQCATVDPVLIPQARVDPLDASGPGELVQAFTLTFRRTGVTGEPISVRYQIVDEDSSARSRVGLSQGPTVVWTAEDSSRDIGSFRSEAYSLLRSGEVTLPQDAVAEQRTVVMRLTNLRDDLAAGIYREQFTVRYWCDAAADTIPYEAPGVVSVSVAVPNVLSANVAGASARGQINFQEFADLTRSLQVSVRSTGPYSVTAQSLNGGELVRENARPGDVIDRIRYTATFDSKALATNGGAPQMMPRAGLLGRQIPLTVKVEGTRDKRAGVYADTLLLTLSPTN